MAENNQLEDNVDMESKFSYSRCSSAGSLHTLISSSNNTVTWNVPSNTRQEIETNSLYMRTDDEDSDVGHRSIKDKRREAHTQAEQKRRDAIKKGYDALQDLVPMCQNSDQNQSYKLSKATVLQKSIDYIQYMQNVKKKQEDEVELLKKEATGMVIMKCNYQEILRAHQNQPGESSKQVPDELKFQVFRAVMDSLFQTFDPCVHTNNFAEVSGSVIAWVEEHCQPQILREVMASVLEQLQQYEATTRGQAISSGELSS